MGGVSRCHATGNLLPFIVVFLAPAFASALRFAESEAATSGSQQGEGWRSYLRQSALKEVANTVSNPARVDVARRRAEEAAGFGADGIQEMAKRVGGTAPPTVAMPVLYFTTTSIPGFTVGQRVQAKDNGDADWLHGTVRALNPLRVLIDGDDTAYEFDIVQHLQTAAPAPAQACADISGTYTATTGPGVVLAQNGCVGSSSTKFSYTVAGNVVTIANQGVTGTITGAKGSYAIVWSNGVTYTEQVTPIVAAPTMTTTIVPMPATTAVASPPLQAPPPPPPPPSPTRPPTPTIATTTARPPRPPRPPPPAAASSQASSAPRNGCFEATADASVDKLDMILETLPPAAFVLVDEVLAGAWAHRNGIRKGMEIVKINGKEAKSMAQQDFTQEMKARPLVFEVCVKASPASSPVGVTAETLRKTFEAAVTKGREAGREAGKEMAKHLVDDLKKALATTPAPTAANATANAPAAANGGILPPGIPPLPGMPPVPGMPGAAPAPSAWQKFAPKYKAANASKPCPKDGGPPQPVPPSPLDALKAAMAIRGNISITDSPILTPDVLDTVARIARGRLGAFVPPAAQSPSGAPPVINVLPPAAPAGAIPPPVQCTPRPCTPPPAPPPAPAAVVPPVTQNKIEFEISILKMSFTALSASPTIYNQVVVVIQSAIAEAAGNGVTANDVSVTMKADDAASTVLLLRRKTGSILITAKIALQQGVDVDAVAANLQRGSVSIVTKIVEQISAITAIQSVSLGNITASSAAVSHIEDSVSTTTTTAPPMRTLPKPPACAAPPPKLSQSDVAMSLAPFKPAGRSGKEVKMSDGGSAWPLVDGGWAFQYPDMAVRMQQDGTTRIVWAQPAYAVEYDDSGISYHIGQNVVHRDANGDLTYQQPTGTMHQEGTTLVYHWCNPNVIVYQTPNGFVYYDDLGMTYRSMGKDVTHYTWNGEVLYQGAGGITRQSPDGTVTHWTDVGAVFRHHDGTVTYTPVGEKKSKPLSIGDLGADPFPGADLTAQSVFAMTEPIPLAPMPAPAYAAGPAPSPPMNAFGP